MKNVLLITLWLFLPFYSSSQVFTDYHKLAEWCKVWGFLKYHHPAVNTHSIDWDSVFIAQQPIVLSFTNSQTLSKHFEEFIDTLNSLHQLHAIGAPSGTNCDFNGAPDILDDTLDFSNHLLQLLRKVANAHCRQKRYVGRVKRNKMVEFINENSYHEMVLPAKEYRLLTLARYWNAIEYFYPYKYKLDADWGRVLEDFVPEFIASGDSISYFGALRMLVAQTNDNHSRLGNSTFKVGTALSLPVKFEMPGNEIIVVKKFDVKNSDTAGLKIGDIVLSMSDVDVDHVVNSSRKYLSSSNTWSQLRDVCMILTFGVNKTVEIEVLRAGEKKRITQKRYSPNEIISKTDEPVYKLVADSIGYVNMSALKISAVNKWFRTQKSTKAIIFDMRGYPNLVWYELMKKLSSQEREFAKMTYPDIERPGQFICYKPMLAGKKNKKCYQGKIVVLIDENTQSRAEFMTMALKSIPGTVLIGTTTAGTDGDVTTIPLPGGFFAKMTSLGVYFPDGQETQRVGIAPDILIEQSKEEILAGKDAILEAAIKHIRNTGGASVHN